MVRWLPPIDHPDQLCEGCLLGKHARNSFPKEASIIAKKPLDLILLVRINILCFLFMLLVEKHSVYFLKEKYEVFTVF